MRKTAVIVGRFQTPILHAGHLYLIGTALQECDRVVIMLGCSESKDERNPYDYGERHRMISKVFPSVEISRINDHQSDDEWNKALEYMITYHCRMGGQAILYHSRDSFKNSYKGKHSLKELPEIPGFSATKIRNELKIKNEYFTNPE